LIENGDIINVDVEKRRIDVLITDEEMEQRRKKWTPPAYKANRGVLYKVCGSLAMTSMFCIYYFDEFSKEIPSFLFPVHQERAVGFEWMCD
jgi:dihydroxyacid dehydratase/phosphogluconate dehydratase